MIASRLWYVVLGIATAFLVFALYVGTSMYDRAAKRVMSEGLNGDAQVVSWYMKDDARKRSSALINFALDAELGAALSKATASPDKLPAEAHDKAKKLLRSVDDKLPADLKFTALFAVDQYGRVVAQVGFDQVAGNADFELGGYPLVADALHGWVRDDTWVLDGRIYKVVARPVETDPSQAPAGAIVGARIFDDSYARELSKRTGAAVAFYAANTRVSAAAPEGFDAGQLDAITSDLSGLAADESYKTKGRTEARILHGNLGVMYARIPGESWPLGAGYAVGRSASLLGGPLAFVQKADDLDKKSVSYPVVVGAGLAVALLGLLFSFIEHTRPLMKFRNEAARFAKGEVDTMAPSKFFSVYRKIAADLNDGVEKIAVKGGGTRKAADLESVLGPLPQQPSMSAFSFPQDAPSASIDMMSLTAPPAEAPKPPPRRPGPPKPPARPSAPQPPVEPEDDSTVVSKIPQEVMALATGEHKAIDDDTADWPQVFDEFVKLKRSNGEPTDNLTFDKFRQTLVKNRDALVARHGCKRVKFTVYVKEGKAALKASPVKD
ncbi:MAG: hypothetical protein IT374_19965 [Polyangiaceae bacterium]|nr:hypothetical protein [Polyangiaceae bacterium]